MKFNQYEHDIGQHFASAIINGDYSGLEDAEAASLDAWMENLSYGLGHWSIDVDNTDEFGVCEVSNLRGATVRVIYNEQVSDQG